MTAKRKLVGREAWLGLHTEWRREAARSQAAINGGSERLTAFWTSRGCVRCVRDLFTRYDVVTLDELEAALRRWRNPRSRRRDRFYCQAHTGPGEAGVARFWRAIGTTAGHTGWAFRMDEWNWRYYKQRVQQGPYQMGSFGSSPGAKNVYEELLVANPITTFAELEYDAYKALPVEDANYEAALIASMKVRETPYLLLLANCLDATHLVLTAYGVRNLPAPGRLLAPALWFQALPGAAVELR